MASFDFNQIHLRRRLIRLMNAELVELVIKLQTTADCDIYIEYIYIEYIYMY